MEDRLSKKKITKAKKLSPRPKKRETKKVVTKVEKPVENSKIEVEQPKYRQVLGKGFPFIVKTFLIADFKDTQCGFKMFTKEAEKKIFPRQTIQGWAFDVEIIFIAQELGYKIKELPVTWVDKGDSKLSPIKDSFKMFNEIIKIKYNSLKGEYKD